MSSQKGKRSGILRRAIDLIYTFPWILILIGLTVFGNWLFDWRNLSPDWTTMKYSSAGTITLLGILAWLLRDPEISDRRATIILTLCFFAAGSMAGINWSDARLFGNDFFRPDIPTLTVAPGLPSMGMTFLTILSSVTVVLFTLVRGKAVLISGGTVTIMFSVTALVGYALGIPGLYFFEERVSSAMPFLGALAYFLLGIYFIFLGVRNGYRTLTQEAAALIDKGT